MRGRGELHLSILIENMLRQGYEFQVSKPQVIYREIDGRKCEPIERMVADVPQAFAGAVIESSCGLVAQDKARVLYQRASDCATLLLAT